MKKDRVDIMVDLETLGRTGEYSIIQTAAIAFNIEDGTHIKTFNMKSNIEKDEHFKVDARTLKWWLETDKELLYDLIKDNEHSTKRIFYDFYRWIWSLEEEYENIYLWGNGILFDNKIIKETFEKYSVEYPINYRCDRDLRTVVDMASRKLNVTTEELKNKFKANNTKPHNALNDCGVQIELLTYCFKELGI